MSKFQNKLNRLSALEKNSRKLVETELKLWCQLEAIKHNKYIDINGYRSDYYISLDIDVVQKWCDKKGLKYEILKEKVPLKCWPPESVTREYVRIYFK